MSRTGTQRKISTAYDGRLFWTPYIRHWFELALPTHDTPSFGKKLLILVGRDPERPFLDSAAGEQLRARLGPNARAIVKAQGANAFAIAFEHEASRADLFAQIRRWLPPRLVEDFLIVDLGPQYCTGDQPISLYVEWAKLHVLAYNMTRSMSRALASASAPGRPSFAKASWHRD